MSSKFEKIFNKITLKHWIIFLTISQVIYCIMLMKTIPYIRKEAEGLQIFDLLPFGYNYAYANTFLLKLSAKGNFVYSVIQLKILDLFYPVLNSISGICLLVLLKKFCGSIKRNTEKNIYDTFFKIGFSLSLSAMFFDYLENIMILLMFSFKSTVSPEIVSISSTFTIIKSMSTILFYILIMVLCIIICSHIIYRKTKGVNIGERF